MGIVRNNFRVSKLDHDPPVGDKGNLSDDEDERQPQTPIFKSNSSSASDSDVDSGAASDDLDLPELGETDSELCQLGDQSFFVPFDLYDLTDLSQILSLDTWNNCLTEEERFNLSQFLPDMDQQGFIRTLKELFSGANFHFGSPLSEIFRGLKGGLCDPRVALYQQGLKFLEKRKHYHFLRKYHNSMVSGLVQIKDAWDKCPGFSIEEKIRVLNTSRNRRQFNYDKLAGFRSRSAFSELEEHVGGLRSKKMKVVSPKHISVERAMMPTLKSSRKLDYRNHGKPNPKGLLKVSHPKVPLKNLNTVNHELNLKARRYKYKNVQLSKTRYTGDGDDVEEPDYEVDSKQKHHTTDSARLSQRCKDQRSSRRDPENIHEYPYFIDGSSNKKSRNAKHMMDLDTPSGNIIKGRYSPDVHLGAKGKKVKHPVSNQGFIREKKPSALKLKEECADRSSGFQVHQDSTISEKPVYLDDSVDVRGHSIRNKRWKGVGGFKVGKSSVRADSKSRIYAVASPGAEDIYNRSSSEIIEPGKVSRRYLLNGKNMVQLRDLSPMEPSEETESDSSDEDNEGEDFNYAIRKLDYPNGVRSNSRGGNALRRIGSHGRETKEEYGQSHMADEEYLPLKRKLKSREHEPRIYDENPRRIHGTSPIKLSDDHRSSKFRKIDSARGDLADVSCVHPNASPLDKKRRPKRDPDYLVPQSDYFKNDELIQSGRVGERAHSYETHIIESDDHDALGTSLFESSSKQPKGRICVDYSDRRHHPDDRQWDLRQIEDSSSSRKKCKKKMDGASCHVSVASSIKTTEEIEDEPDVKPLKRQFPLITPTVHTGFSFSIVHLLSAVRMAMISPISEDGDGLRSGEKLDVNVAAIEQVNEKSLPALTVQEIVNRVRSDPGDPCILETQEPLQDLIRGVLKIFASKTAPLGAKGWKALVIYDKAKKCWSWIGPVTSNSSENDLADDETSAVFWGIPHKMLVKLVDAFANWLKSGQETLRQIGSLPAPPVELMSQIDDKERFKDLRAQKSLNTFGRSSDEVKAYFQREENLRYSAPDRAFSYTAIDGRKSIVAPLRRCGGKPTSKARDHFMLKPDRPPHVTILCLVRDAAARLPGNIGTRADVCTLIRDSQYIVEDVTDAQVNQVVSGALDRLHYERDPCVQFDAERKLWVYLHRDREEEDFEDDGTSSTKKWKRQRKDPSDQMELMQEHDSGAGENAGGGCGTELDFGLEYNMDPSSAYDQEGGTYNSLRSNIEVNMDPLVDAVENGMRQGHPMGWELLPPNHYQEKKLFCQENSMNEAFEDEGFGCEGRVRVVTTGLI